MGCLEISNANASPIQALDVHGNLHISSRSNGNRKSLIGCWEIPPPPPKCEACWVTRAAFSVAARCNHLFMIQHINSCLGHTFVQVLFRGNRMLLLRCPTFFYLGANKLVFHLFLHNLLSTKEKVRFSLLCLYTNMPLISHGHIITKLVHPPSCSFWMLLRLLGHIKVESCTGWLDLLA